MTNRYQKDKEKSYYVSNTLFTLDSHFSDLKILGKGSYGVVVSAYSEKLQKKIAIKKITPVAKHIQDCKHVLREIRLLRYLGKHENIITLEDLILREQQDELYIVMELMDSDLHHIIQSKQPLTEQHFQHFMYQLFCGLKYLHDNRIIHRDLKPGNLLVSRDCKLRITDFGLARERPMGKGNNPDESVHEAMTEHVVTRWYRPPELMLCPDGLYTYAVDIWSCGCIFAEMLGRNPLFPGKNFVHQLSLVFDVIGSPKESEVAHITNHEARKFLTSQSKKSKVPFHKIFPDASAVCWELLDQLLVFRPESRITVDQALQSSFLAQYYIPECQVFPLIPKEKFEFSFERQQHLTRYQSKELIVKEVQSFRKERFPATGSNESKGKGRSQSNIHPRPTPQQANSSSNASVIDDNSSRVSQTSSTVHHSTTEKDTPGIPPTTRQASYTKMTTNNYNNRSSSAPRMRPSSTSTSTTTTAAGTGSGATIQNPSKSGRNPLNTTTIINAAALGINQEPKAKKDPITAAPFATNTSTSTADQNLNNKTNNKINHNNNTTANNIDKLLAQFNQPDAYDSLFSPKKPTPGSVPVTAAEDPSLSASKTSNRPQTSHSQGRLSIDNETILSKYERYSTEKKENLPLQHPATASSSSAASAALQLLPQSQIDHLTSLLPQPPSTMETLLNPETANLLNHQQTNTTGGGGGRSPGRKSLRLSANYGASLLHSSPERKQSSEAAATGASSLFAEKKESSVASAASIDPSLRRSYKQSKIETEENEKQQQQQRQKELEAEVKASFSTSFSTSLARRKEEKDNSSNNNNNNNTTTTTNNTTAISSSHPLDSALLTEQIPTSVPYSPQKPKKSISQTYTSPKRIVEGPRASYRRFKEEDSEEEEEKVKESAQTLFRRKSKEEEERERGSVVDVEEDLSLLRKSRQFSSHPQTLTTAKADLRSRQNEPQEEEEEEEEEEDLKALRAKYSEWNNPPSHHHHHNHLKPSSTQTTTTTENHNRFHQKSHGGYEDHHSIGSTSHQTKSSSSGLAKASSTVTNGIGANASLPPAAPPVKGAGGGGGGGSGQKKRLTVPKSPKFSTMSWQRRQSDYEHHHQQQQQQQVLQNAEKRANKRATSVGKMRPSAYL